jgi:hypothetical protein
MHSAARHLTRWTILTALAGILIAVIVYLRTADVVWTLVPLLLTVAAVRLLRRRATR